MLLSGAGTPAPAARSPKARGRGQAAPGGPSGGAAGAAGSRARAAPRPAGRALGSLPGPRRGASAPAASRAGKRAEGAHVPARVPDPSPRQFPPRPPASSWTLRGPALLQPPRSARRSRWGRGLGDSGTGAPPGGSSPPHREDPGLHRGTRRLGGPVTSLPVRSSAPAGVCACVPRSSPRLPATGRSCQKLLGKLQTYAYKENRRMNPITVSNPFTNYQFVTILLIYNPNPHSPITLK